MFRDLHNYSKVLSLFPPAARTSTANGTAVQTQGHIGHAAAVLHSAAGTGTSPTLIVKLQHGDQSDGSDAADVSGAVFATVTDSGASLQKIKLNLHGLKKYVRAVATIAGTSPSFTFNVTLLVPPKSEVPVT